MKYFIAYCFLFTLTLGSSQDTIYWDNGAGDHLWTNPLNWDTDVLPTSSDYTYLGSGGLDVIIPSGSNISIQRLFLFHQLNLTIEANATLNINGSIGDGFYCRGNVYNYGTIKIENTAQSGLYLWLYNQPSERYFENYGDIYIDVGIGKDGIEHNDTSRLINHTSGYIEIENYTENAIDCGEFSNFGKVKILGDNGNPGLHLNMIDSKYINEECGKTIMQSQITIVNGTITNNGFFKQEYDGTNAIPTYGFVNNGILEDVLDAYQSGDILNNSFWSKPFSVLTFEGSLQSIFKIGIDSASFSMSSIYNDHDLITQAGSYNNTDNIWMPNASAVGDSVFFVAVTDISSGCIDTIKFLLDSNVEPMNYWVGNSGLWLVASNWSTGQVPQSGENAAIFKKNITVTNPIGNTANVGSLISHSSILNKPGASIFFRNGLLDQALNMELGTLTNNGIIDISNYEIGLIFDDVNVLNNNVINIDSCSLGLYFHEQNATFFFTNSGDINIDNTVSGMSVRNMINDAAGEITINCPSNSILGFFSYDLDNYGDIFINGDGVGDGFDGHIDNYATGTIMVDNLITGIDYYGDNFGNFIAKNSTTGIKTKDGGSLINNKTGGSITVDSCNSGLLVYYGTFTNEADGQISINHCNYGSTVNDGSFFSSIYFLNYGNLDILNSNVAGLKLFSVFNNYSTGTININTSLNYGIHVLAGKLLNEGGDINIKNTTGIGINLEGSTIDNKIGGTLLLDSLGGDAISLNEYQDIVLVSSNFQNYGNVHISENVSGNSITATMNSTIYNQLCQSILNIAGPIIHPGLFTNFGVLHQQQAAIHSLSSNFTNYGILIDSFQTFAGQPINDLGYIFNNIIGQYEEGDSILNPLNDNCVTYQITIDTTWYEDPELTIPTGHYDDINKIFIPNSSAVGDSIFYFSTDRGNGCWYDTLSIEFQIPISEQCGTNIWTGGTSVWNDINNWSLGRLPSTCDIIQIMNATDSILINNSYNANIKQLSVAGSLLINPNASLTINGSPGHGLINNGKVQNKGTLTIQNSTNSGVRNMASSLFINEGTFNVQNSGTNGIRQDAATFNNLGIIVLSNSFLYGLLLKNGAVFIDNGSVTLY